MRFKARSCQGSGSICRACNRCRILSIYYSVPPVLQVQRAPELPVRKAIRDLAEDPLATMGQQVRQVHMDRPDLPEDPQDRKDRRAILVGQQVPQEAMAFKVSQDLRAMSVPLARKGQRARPGPPGLLEDRQEAPDLRA